VRFSLGGQARPPALFHFVGELPHGLLGGNAWCPRFASALWTLTWESLYPGCVWPSHSQ